MEFEKKNRSIRKMCLDMMINNSKKYNIYLLIFLYLNLF